MATGITLVKSMSYRGKTELWSNTYWLTAAPPVGAAGWATLIDALIAQEKTLYGPEISIVKGYAYTDPSDDRVAVYVHDKTGTPVAGTGAFNLGQGSPGDSAMWIRWKTSRLSTKGKPIYLRKYYHGAVATVVNGQTHADTPLAAQVTAMQAFGLKMRDGTFAESRTLTDKDNTDTLTSHAVSPFIGYRQLRKGRKRPPA
jgi:hypothetical protein